jgi:hypothetical protein
LYLYLHVWHLSIDSEHAPHDLHRFNLGSNESIRFWNDQTIRGLFRDFGTTRRSAC